MPKAFRVPREFRDLQAIVVSLGQPEILGQPDQQDQLDTKVLWDLAVTEVP